MTNFKNDPDNYRKMSEPHKSMDDANEALQKFYDKVSEARKECQIADVLVITKDTYFLSDGTIGIFIQHSQFGNQLNGLSMAAYAFGQLQAAYAFGQLQDEQKEFLSKLSNGKLS